MPLHTKYQVTNLDDIVGNDDTVKSLISVLNREEDVPHTYLFTGPAGTGKSTFAEIVKDELGCSDNDFFKYNAASKKSRGIDMTSEIEERCVYAPSNGKVKFYLLEECFHKDTLVTRANNELIKIKDIEIGSKVKNLHGVDTVEKVFINKVPLNRMVTVHLSNGVYIVCSKDHLFYTENKKWVKAKNLDNTTFLCFDSDTMSKLSVLEGKDEKELLQRMQHRNTQEKEILLQPMFSPVQRKTYEKRVQLYMQNMWRKICRSCLQFSTLSRVQKRENRLLPKVWERVYKFKSESNKILFWLLFGKMEKCTTRFSESSSLRRKEESGFTRAQEIKNKKSTTLERCSTKNIRSYEKEQSNGEQRYHSKNDKYKRKKWNFAFTNFTKGWEWFLHKSTINSTYCFAMANGSNSSYSTRNPKRGETNFLQATQLPHSLQTGSSETGIETSYRSGWCRTPYAAGERERQEERKETKRIRVDHITFYEQADNREPAFGFVSNKEKEQGFIEFYDLQVKENPSYIANGCMVHNCHALTPAAQEALLEIIHRPPSHVYFGLCTTEPEKLKPTFKRRCHHYILEPLNRGQLLKLLTRVLKEEGIDDYPKSVLNKIIPASNGSAGIALNLLDKVIDIEDENEALTVIENTTISETAVNEVAQSILTHDTWPNFATKVKGLKGDAESLRRAFATYFSKVMMGSKTEEKASLMMEVLEPFMDNTTTMYAGKAGLDYSLTFAWNATG
jgi:DNA polymerase III gamma/tau subunit